MKVLFTCEERPNEIKPFQDDSFGRAPQVNKAAEAAERCWSGVRAENQRKIFSGCKYSVLGAAKQTEVPPEPKPHFKRFLKCHKAEFRRLRGVTRHTALTPHSGNLRSLTAQ